MRRFIVGPVRARLGEMGWTRRNRARSRRRSRLTACEPLESRALLATLNIVSGALTFDSVPGVADNLSIGTTAPSGNYVISDSTTTITLGVGAVHAGWKFVGSSNNAVTGPVASVSSIAADTGDGNDTVTVQSAAAPVALTFTNTAGNIDTVVIGGAQGQGAQGVKGPVSIVNVNGATNLTVDDSADTQGQSPTISSTTITGLAPSTINYSTASLASLSVNGGEGGNSFTVSSLPSAIVTLSTGASAALDPNHANSNTVAVLSTADPANHNTLQINSQGLDVVNLSSGTSIKVTGTAKIPHAADSLTVNATAADAVTLANSAAGSLNGAVLLAGAPGSMALTLDDSADATARVVLVSSGVIAGLLPAPVSYTPDDLTSLTLIGAGRLDTLNVNADKHGPVAVAAGAAVGSGTITIGAALPLVYQGMAAVNVTNAADQGLTIQNTTVVTTTGDAPLEGKAFPYLAASFVDEDPNAKSSNFTAVINWGDGSAPSAGSISSQGTVNGQPLFDVSASHTYLEAGTYSVVVTITDTGTGAVPAEIGGIPVTITDLGGSAVTTGSTAQVNLVSNGAYPAANTDANLVNPWGIAASPTGPFWVGNNGTSLATLYNGAGTPQSLVVSIPGGAPTGVAFNPFAASSPSEFVISSGSSSGPAIFLFATQSGQIDGWNPSVPPPAPATSAQVAVSLPGAQFTGLALATNGGSDVLYAADFHNGVVDMFDSNFNLTGSFTDPSLPAGYAPYNVTNIGGDLYVTFAKQDAAAQNPVPGLGEGFVDVFSPAGALLTQLVANAPLDEPWGVALAPADFGQFSGDLLVANSGDGRINAFNPATGAFVGALVDGSNNPIVIPGLHGLSFGNGGSAGAANTLFFTAGSTSGNQGLLGSLTPTPFTAQIGEAALKASVVNVSAVEGNPFVWVVANFTDDNPYSQLADYTATINWGDGSPPSTGTVQPGNGLGAYVVVVDSADHNTHTYADETGSPNHLGPYNISVTIAENDGGASVSADGFASVADAPLIQAVGLSPPGTLDANVAIPGFTVATFVDTNPGALPSDFVSEGQPGMALIDWGDGSTSLGTVVGSGGNFSVQTTGHTYLKGGPFQIKTSIVDIGGKTASATTNVLVNAIHASIVNVSAVEGNVFSGVIANFTDDNITAVASDFSAAVNWGGAGGGSTVSIVPGSTAGAFIVLGSFTYADETGSAVHPQPYNISVTIDDTPIGGGSGATVGGFASVADAPLLPAVGLAPSGTLDVNVPIPTFTTATFVDTNPGATASDFVSEGQSGVALIDWGDGSASLGAVIDTGPVAGGESFAVQGGHTYLKGGPFQIKTSIVDIGGKSTSATANVVVNALHASVVNVSAVEGNVFSGVIANFTDDNTTAVASDFSASVDWGGLGTGSSVSIVPGSTAGAFIVLGTFLYAEETGSAFQPQPYNIAVSIDDSPIGGGSAATVAGFASVADAALVAGPTLSLTVTEGVTPSGVLLATFADANALAVPADFVANGVSGAATIDWGDGTASLGTIAGPVGGPFTITGTKPSPYVKVGTSEIKISVTDVGGKSTSMVANATITEAALAGTGTDVTGIEGEPLIDPVTGSTSVQVATFTDPNTSAPATDFKASIDWGDGTSGSGVVDGGGGVFEVLGSHKYAKAGTYDITITVDDSAGDAGGFQLQIDPTADIAGETLAAGQGFPALTTKVGTPLNNIGIGTFLVSNPTPIPGPQPDTAADFSVSINWGDGPADTTTGSVSIVGNSGGDTVFRVSGSHTYTTAGNYNVTATITDDDGGDFPVGPLTVTVQPTTYTLTALPATANLPEGVPEDGEVIATVTDTNPNANGALTASITSENPDITATNAMVTPLAGTSTYVVTADLSGDDSSNTGAERDGGGLLITITDSNSNMSTAVSSQVNLYDPVLLDPGVKVQAAPGRLFQGPVASFSTTDSRATVSDFTAVINWGDGQSSSGTIVASGPGGFSVAGDHNYAAAGVFSVSTTITNDEGMSVSDTSTASVSTPISARGVTIAPLARKRFSGAVATFLTHVPVVASDFSALITWSDGATSPGVVVAQGAAPGGERFKILGSHAFARKVRVSATVSIVENGGTPTLVSIGGRASRQTARVAHTLASQSTHARKPDVVGAAHPKGPHAEFAVYGWIDNAKSQRAGHAKS